MSKRFFRAGFIPLIGQFDEYSHCFAWLPFLDRSAEVHPTWRWFRKYTRYRWKGRTVHTCCGHVEQPIILSDGDLTITAKGEQEPVQ